MSRKKPSSQTISFRLDPEVLRLLDQHRMPFGLSRGEWVRGVITSILDGTLLMSEDHFEQLGAEMGDAIKHVRNDLSALLYVLLVKIGNVSPDSAMRCVREFFLED